MAREFFFLTIPVKHEKSNTEALKNYFIKKIPVSHDDFLSK